jgi:hypothetical protein
MDIEINGSRQMLSPASIEELQGHLRGAVPPDEVMCVLRVNGEEVAEDRLRDYECGSIQTIELQTARPEALAQNAIPETIDWIQRLTDVLRSLAEEYRLGRERNAVQRLVPVTDALHVIVGLLSGIHEFIKIDPTIQIKIEAPWSVAEARLRTTLDRFVSEFEAGDPVLMADLLGHDLPAVLESFSTLLKQIQE